MLVDLASAQSSALIKPEAEMALPRLNRETPVEPEAAELLRRSSTSTETEKSVETLNLELQKFNLELNFSRDRQTGKTVVSLVDRQSGDVVRQIPSEVSLHLSAVLGKLQGRLFSCKI